MASSTCGLDVSVADELDAGSEEELVALVGVELSTGMEGTVEVSGEVGVEVVEPAGGDVVGGVCVDVGGIAPEFDGTDGGALLAIVVSWRPVVDALLADSPVDALLLDGPVIVDEGVLGSVLGEVSPPSVAPHANPASPARVAEVRGAKARDKSAATRDRFRDIIRDP